MLSIYLEKHIRLLCGKNATISSFYNAEAESGMLQIFQIMKKSSKWT